MFARKISIISTKKGFLAKALSLFSVNLMQIYAKIIKHQNNALIIYMFKFKISYLCGDF